MSERYPNSRKESRRRPTPPGIKPPEPGEQGMTVAEWAHKYRLSEMTVRRYIHQGMPTLQPGGWRGKHIIYESQVRQWINEFRCIGAAPGGRVSADLDRDTHQPEPNGADGDGTEAVS